MTTTATISRTINKALAGRAKVRTSFVGSFIALRVEGEESQELANTIRDLCATHFDNFGLGEPCGCGPWMGGTLVNYRINN